MTLPKFTIPHSEEAEEAVLGSILINSATYPGAASLLREDDFYLLRHRYVWRAMSRIHDRGDPIDYLTVQLELEALKLLDEIGGPAFLTHLSLCQGSSLYADVYARLVQRGAVRRQIMAASDELILLAQDETLTIQQVIERAEHKLSSATGRIAQDTINPIREAVDAHFETLEQQMSDPLAAMGIPTGLNSLDMALGGLRKRRIYYIGARTHHGKTSLALTIALNAARLGAAPMIVTMEETTEDLTNRLMALELGVAVDRLGKGALTAQEYTRYVEAAGRIGMLNLCIDAVPTITPRTLAQHVLAQQSRTRVDLVIIDYLQLMSAGPYDRDGEYAKLLYIARTLPMVARRCNIPIWCNVQVNRSVEKREDKRPQLTDFEGCGKIEQSADVAMVLYRDVRYDANCLYPDQAEMIIRKNKVNGQHSTVLLRFDGLSTRFTDWQERDNGAKLRQTPAMAREG